MSPEGVQIKGIKAVLHQGELHIAEILRDFEGFCRIDRQLGDRTARGHVWQMGRLGVPDRYVDAFCGRVLQSVLARHYTDFSPERLKEIYDHAGLRIFDGDEISYTRDKSDDYRSHTLMLIRQKEESGQPQS